jgi:hypothetical protein
MVEQSVEKFHRIKGLDCYEEVEEMLYAGYPTSAVAEFIQKQNREYVDVRRKSLEEMLRLFRESLSDGVAIASTLPRQFIKAQQNFANKMAELEILGEMLQSQLYRFDVAHAHERMENLIDSQVEKQIDGITKTIMKIHSIKMDLGLIGSRDLGTITVSAERLEYIKNKYGEKAAKAFDNPVSRGRVLAALSAMRRLGKLRDKEGNLINLEDKMALTEEDRRIINAEYHEVDEVTEVVKEETEEGVDKQEEDAIGEEKQVEPEPEPESELEPEPEPEPPPPKKKLKAPAAMLKPENNLPPGPIKTGLKKIPRK